MRLSFIAASLTAAILFASGCGSGSKGSYVGKPSKSPTPADLRPGDEQNLFPFKAGNKWTYSVQSTQAVGSQTANSTGEITIGVTKVTPTDGGLLAALETQDKEGKVTQQQSWISDKTGIYQVATGKVSTPYVPKQPAVIFPLKPGSGVFEWSGTGITPIGEPGSNKNINRVLSVQQIDTEEGPMSAIPIESRGTFDTKDKKGKPIHGLVLTTTYWVPNVGIGRYRQEIQFGSIRAVQTLSLKSHVVK